MNQYDLEFFKYTAKYKNITKAAKHFYVSQSTLSRNIMSLETELGVKLFERSNKNILLTPAGEQLYKDCDLLIKHLETVSSKVQDVAKSGKGTLRVALPSMLDKNVYQTLKTFKASHKDIEMLIELYDFDELTSAILHGLYHVAFTYNFALEYKDDNEDIVATPLSKDTFSLIIPDFMYENPSIETIPQIVKQLPLFLPNLTDPPFMNSLIRKLENYSDNTKINKIYVNSRSSALLSTSLGLGFTIMPTSDYDLSVNNNYVEKIDLGAFDANTTIIMINKKETKNEIANKFIEYVNKNAIK